jgi:transcriptional regulator with XRE-family HTH domain
MEAKIRLGNFLRKLRDQAGLTQSDVAKKLGYSSAQFISNWERGDSYPPVKAIRTIAKLYKTDIDRLFELVLEISLDITEEGMRREFDRIKKLK